MTNQHSSTMWVQSTHVAGKVRLLDPLDRPEEVKTVVSWMLEWKIWVFFLGWTVLPSGFLLPLLWPASFFSCLKRMKNEIYIYIYWVMFFLGTVDVVCVCWCFIRYTNGSCSVFMLVIIWFVTGIGYRCVWSKTKGTWSGIGDITVE